MPFNARVVKVMIASPGDVANERQRVREVLAEWNNIHAEDRKLVLMPIGWETHSTPTMGDRPQAIINKQVLANCDLLVAVFWTRIGSPTGVAPSGTVEEIQEHLNSGKPAMLYFSSAPVRPDSVDDKQYAALKKFKQECYKKGLVESYDSIGEFGNKFSRQLSQTIIRFYPKGDFEALDTRSLQQAVHSETCSIETYPPRDAAIMLFDSKNLFVSVKLHVINTSDHTVTVTALQFADKRFGSYRIPSIDVNSNCWKFHGQPYNWHVAKCVLVESEGSRYSGFEKFSHFAPHVIQPGGTTILDYVFHSVDHDSSALVESPPASIEVSVLTARGHRFLKTLPLKCHDLSQYVWRS